MHRRIYQEFQKICAEKFSGGSVLEVGAVPSKQSLLCMEALSSAKEKIGINLDGPHDFEDFRILQGNANSMDCFEDEQFDLVLCNSLLEHDKYFWKTVAEIRRVLKKGAWAVLGTPGYTYLQAEKIQNRLIRIPGVRELYNHQYLNMLFTATMTFKVHAAPSDYYRFSPEAYREVLLDGLENKEVRSLMLPPRIIGLGMKPL